MKTNFDDLSLNDKYDLLKWAKENYVVFTVNCEIVCEASSGNQYNQFQNALFIIDAGKNISMDQYNHFCESLIEAFCKECVNAFVKIYCLIPMEIDMKLLKILYENPDKGVFRA